MELAVRNRCDRNRRQTGVSIRQGRGARELAVRKAGVEELIRGGRCVDSAVWDSRRDGRPANRAQQSSLKSFRIWRIRTDEIGDAARQDVAKQAKATSQDCVRRELPCD